MMSNTYHKQGFTIFEVIVTAAIASVIVLAVGKFSNTITSVGGLIGNKLQTSQDLAQVFRGIVIEIRSISPSSAGGYGIESASTSSLVFFSDIDLDGKFERVRYFLASSTLQKGIVRPTGNPPAYVTSTEVITSLIPNIVPVGNVFSYYGSVATGTAVLLSSPVAVSAIRTVTMALTADVSTSTSPRPTTIDATITIRNLRSN